MRYSDRDWIKVNRHEKNINHYLIIDGYNIINAWDNLKELAKEDLEDSREKLIDDIIEFSEFMGYKTIIVLMLIMLKILEKKLKKKTHNNSLYKRTPNSR